MSPSSPSLPTSPGIPYRKLKISIAELIVGLVQGGESISVCHSVNFHKLGSIKNGQVKGWAYYESKMVKLLPSSSSKEEEIGWLFGIEKL